VGLAVASGAAATTPVARTVSAPAPAQWRTYDLLIDLQGLPQSYSCMDLWYKFRDVLLQIGARHYMLIEPQRCQVKGGAAEHSPSVHVKFQLPFQLSPAQARFADTASVHKLIRLSPGQPASLQAADCELMQQLRDELLGTLPVRVTAAAFNCRASHVSFTVTLDAPVATPEPGAAAAAARR
jgi:hypothetical protein